MNTADRKLITCCLPVLLGLVSIVPLIANLKYFKRLFWFGDELHQLVLISNDGFMHWALSTFAENFVPLFKLIWGGMVYAFNGSYLAMIVAVWITHAINVYLFAKILRKTQFSFFSILLSAATFGLTWSNLETLAWTIQWSAVLSITFFLLAILLFVGKAREFENNSKASLSNVLGFFLLLLASTLCFSRGVISCAALAFYGFIFFVVKKQYKSAVIYSIAAIVPAILVGSVIFEGSTGNHHGLLSQGSEVTSKMVLYGLHYLFLNPLFHLLRIDGDPRFLWQIGTAKILLIVLGFIFAKNSFQRIFLTFLLAFDLGNAIVLAIGRYHEGAIYANSWRYQYSSLISTMPFVALVIDKLINSLFSNERFRKLSCAILLIFCCAYIVYPWKAKMDHWSGWRGKEGRKALIRQNPNFRSWLGVPPVITYEEARNVVVKYNLH